MDKKVRSIAICLAIYVLIFLVGFRAGEIYNRMKKGYKAEKVVIPDADVYYVIEERDYGTYRDIDFRQANGGDAIIQFLHNEKLKPLLKQKKVQIYKSNGDRAY